MASKKGKGKLPSQLSIQVSGKGPSAYKDIDWKNLSNEEALSMEKEGSFAWKILSNSQTQHLLTLSPEDLEKELSEIMDLPNPVTDLSDAALLDYYVSGFWWGKEQKWNEQQISGLFTLLHRLMENIRDKNMSVSENLATFKEWFVGIATDREDQNGGLDFLDIRMARNLADFVTSTLFQHHKLYEFLFHGERKEEIICTDLLVDVVPPADLPHPPPLEEGVTEALHQRHIAPPPPADSAMSEHSLKDNGQDEQSTSAGNAANAEAEEKVDEDVLSGVSAEEVKTVFDEVMKEMFTGLQNHVAVRLRERETDIISRINKIHQIADT